MIFSFQALTSLTEVKIVTNYELIYVNSNQILISKFVLRHIPVMIFLTINLNSLKKSFDPIH